MNDSRRIIGPFNRVEGDLEIHIDIEDGRVAKAFVNSPLFRGFEQMLLGKSPMDALTITPRICGICSISQSVAAARALADLAGETAAPDGARMAALLHAVENVADHLTHFNVFFMPDFARLAYEGYAWHGRMLERFTAMEGQGLRRAVEARAELLHIVGLLGGKWPHTLAIQPGGITRTPSARDKVRMAASLRSFRRYLEQDMFGAPLETFCELTDPNQLMAWRTGSAGLFIEAAVDLDLVHMGPGPGRYLSFGAYPGPEGMAFKRGLVQTGEPGPKPLETASISEDLSHAWMLGDTAHPHDGVTHPDEDMAAPAYSWCKAPRLDGETVEVGAFARQVVDGHPLALALAEERGSSVLARVAGRLLELARTQSIMENLLAATDTGERFMSQFDLPEEGKGEGLVEAARGALGHWIKVEKGQISGYQIIAPTTWNFSPRDANGTPGPIEAALEGALVDEGEDTPLAVQHIVRSFDPCMVCTVH